MNDVMNLLDAKLKAAFAPYPASEAMTDLKDEIRSNLAAAAEEKLATGMTAQQAADEAWTEFGPLGELLKETAGESAGDEATDNADQGQQAEDKPHHGRNININFGQGAHGWDGDLDTLDDFLQQTLSAAKDGAKKAMAAGSAAMSAGQDAAREAADQARHAAEEAATGGAAAADAAREAAAQTKAGAQAVAAPAKQSATAAKEAAKAAQQEVVDGLDREPANVLTAELADVAHVVIDYPVADLVVVPTDAAELTVEERFSTAKPAYFGTLTQAGDTVTVHGGNYPHSTVRVVINGHRFGFWAQATVRVPRSFTGTLAVSTTAGNVTLSDFAQAVAVRLQATSGDLLVARAQLASLAATTKSGDTQLETVEIAGAVKVTAASGDVVLHHVQAAELTAETASGDVEASEVAVAGPLDLSAKSGDVMVNAVTSDAPASFVAASGDVKLTTVSSKAALTASTKSGEVIGETLTAPTLTLMNVNGDIRAKKIAGAIDATTVSGDLKLSLRELTGDLAVHASSGDVRVKLPGETPFAFDLQTGDGELRTKFGQQATVTDNSRHHQTGTVGAAPQYHVTAVTSNGDLSVGLR